MKRFIILLFVMFSFSAHAQPSTQAENLKAYADILLAQGQYQKLLAESQLIYAQTNLTNAQAAGQWEYARQLELLVDRAELQLRMLRRDERQLRNKAEDIAERARAAQTIMAGQVSQRALQALNYLQINAVEPSVAFKALAVEIPALDRAEFIGLEDGEEFTGTNAGQLIVFLRSKNVTVEPWGNAHQILAQVLIDMSEGVDARLATIQMRLDQLRETVNPFDLPEDPFAN